MPRSSSRRFLPSAPSVLLATCACAAAASLQCGGSSTSDLSTGDAGSSSSVGSTGSHTVGSSTTGESSGTSVSSKSTPTNSSSGHSTETGTSSVETSSSTHGHDGGIEPDAARSDSGTSSSSSPGVDAARPDTGTSSTGQADGGHSSTTSSSTSASSCVNEAPCTAAGPTCVRGATPTLDTCTLGNDGCFTVTATETCTTTVAHATATCTADACAFACTAPYVASGGACEAPAPQQVSPLSGSFVNTKLPAFTWALAPGFTAAHLDVCYDRACTDIVFSADVVGTTTTVPAGSVLPQGNVFWRLFTDDAADAGAGATSTISSPVWEMELPGGAGSYNASLTTWWGVVPDFDGDGFADFLTSTQSTGPGGGTVLNIYPGGETALGTPTQIAADFLGLPLNSPSPIGDFNGDGFVDLVGGSPSPTCPNCLGIYSGSPAGLPATPDGSISLQDLEGREQGFAVGDVNGDGFADFVVVSETPQDMNGNSYIVLDQYYGAASGLAVVPVTVTTTILANLGGGSSVCDAADVNGDGFADVLVVNGAPPSSGPGTAGTGLVFHGSADGAAATASVLTIPGTDFGGVQGIAAAGDINGDGYVDVLVGVGDDTILFEGGSPDIDTTASATIPTGFEFGRNGAGTPALGDFNGDGYADIALPGTTAPYVFVYLGGSGGLVTATPTSLEPTPPAGYTIADGANSNNDPLSGTADLNGDGFPDLGVTVQWQNTTGSTYTTYVFLGGAPIPAAPWTGTAFPTGEVQSVR